MRELRNTMFFLGLMIFYSGIGYSQDRGRFFEKVGKIADSIKVDDITIYNLFKYQVLAHANNNYDSALIIEKVYLTHPKIWDELYGPLFDSATFTPQGLVEWNKNIFEEKQDSIISRVSRLMTLNFDSLLRKNLIQLKTLTQRSPENVKLSIIFSPFEGIGFGGIHKDAFILDLVDYNFDIYQMIREGIPHEFAHFIYDDTRIDDPYKSSPLRLTIDEGFACYYVHKAFDGKISKWQAVEQMTAEDWQWYLGHEKEIYERCSPHFFTEGKNDPLRKIGNEMGAPESVFYWLGFRVIQSYVDKHGEDSWLDIYELPIKDVLEKSGYPEYIERLE